MIKLLLQTKIVLLALLLIINLGAFAQKKGKVHIKITEDGKKIDTVIEFKDDIEPDKIKSIISAITGEEVDVKVLEKGDDDLVWISAGDVDGDFHFDFDFDSTLENTFIHDDLTDSLLLKHGIIKDSANNFVFKSDGDKVLKWVSDNDKEGKNVFIMKGDSIFSEDDSVFKFKGDDAHMMMKRFSSDEDMEEFILEMKQSKGKDDKIIMKTRVTVDDEDGEEKVKKVVVFTDKEGSEKENVFINKVKDEDVIIKSSEDGKTKTIVIEIETSDDGKDIE